MSVATKGELRINLGEDRSFAVTHGQAAPCDLSLKTSEDPRPQRPGDTRTGRSKRHRPVGFLPRRAPALPDLQAHVGDDDTLGAQSLNVQVKLTSSIVPDVVDEFGITEHLGVASAPPGLTTRQPVVVPDPHRDAEHQADGHPARRDQLGEILAGQVAGERPPKPSRARRPHRGADGPELLDRPAGNSPTVSRTPTTPWPPSSAHSARIRAMAVRRGWYRGCTSGPNDPGRPCPDSWVTDRSRLIMPSPNAPGQLRA